MIRSSTFLQIRFFIFAITLLIFSCSSTENNNDKIASVLQPIVGGVSSTHKDDSVILLYYSDKEHNENFLCSSLLISPTILVTARHCVSKLLPDVKLYCASKDEKNNIAKNYEVKKFQTFAGVKFPDNIYDNNNFINVNNIYVNDNLNICNDDIAFVELQRPYYNINVSKISVKRPIYEDNLEAVGWGLNYENDEIYSRKKRADIKLINDKNYVNNSEFVVSEGPCYGDSGGPIYKQGTDIAFGVLSRGRSLSKPEDNVGPCVKNILIYTFIYDKIELLKKVLAVTGEVIELSDGSKCNFQHCLKRDEPGYNDMQSFEIDYKRNVSCAIHEVGSHNDSGMYEAFILIALMITSFVITRLYWQL